MIEVVVIEDQKTIRESLAALLSGTDGYRCVGAYDSCEEFLPLLDDLLPDVILMDIGLNGMSGIEGVKQIRKIFTDATILMLTIHKESDLVFEALCAGACGYLAKPTPPARLLEAIKEAQEGGSPMSAHIARKVVNLVQQKNLYPSSSSSLLTAREREVLEGLARGNSYQAVADVLHISMGTIRYHIRNVYRKLHVHSQSEAVAKALRKGLI